MHAAHRIKVLPKKEDVERKAEQALKWRTDRGRALINERIFTIMHDVNIARSLDEYYKKREVAAQTEIAQGKNKNQVNRDTMRGIREILEKNYAKLYPDWKTHSEELRVESTQEAQEFLRLQQSCCVIL